MSMLSAGTEWCLRRAASGCPDDLAQALIREWQAELHHLSTDASAAPAVRAWRQIRYAVSLAAARSRYAEAGAAESWRERLPAGRRSGAPTAGILAFGMALVVLATAWAPMMVLPVLGLLGLPPSAMSTGRRQIVVVLVSGLLAAAALAWLGRRLGRAAPPAGGFAGAGYGPRLRRSATAAVALVLCAAGWDVLTAPADGGLGETILRLGTLVTVALVWALCIAWSASGAPARRLVGVVAALMAPAVLTVAADLLRAARSPQGSWSAIVLQRLATFGEVAITRSATSMTVLLVIATAFVWAYRDSPATAPASAPPAADTPVPDLPCWLRAGAVAIGVVGLAGWVAVTAYGTRTALSGSEEGGPYLDVSGAHVAAHTDRLFLLAVGMLGLAVAARRWVLRTSALGFTVLVAVDCALDAQHRYGTATLILAGAAATVVVLAAAVRPRTGSSGKPGAAATLGLAIVATLCVPTALAYLVSTSDQAAWIGAVAVANAVLLSVLAGLSALAVAARQKSIGLRKGALVMGLAVLTAGLQITAARSGTFALMIPATAALLGLVMVVARDRRRARPVGHALVTTGIVAVAQVPLFLPWIILGWESGNVLISASGYSTIDGSLTAPVGLIAGIATGSVIGLTRLTPGPRRRNTAALGDAHPITAG